MPLFRLTDIYLAYGTQVLLNKVNLTIQPGERWGLLGRNGTGKTTFMKLLNGSIKADGGEFWKEPEIRIAYLDQELPASSTMTVFDYVADGLADSAALIKKFHHLIEMEPTAQVMQQMEEVQREIDIKGAWSLQQKVENVMTILDLPNDKTMAELSGGWARRVALGQALVSDPDVLLLDEPTNHLDIPAIQWLEKQLQDFRGAVVVITHDRSFLQQVANRILELDRGNLRVWQHDYQRFLVFRDQQLDAEAKANHEFDRKMALEEVWIRQGIKARRTRNEGRVRALEAMRNEFSARRYVEGKANMQVNVAEQSGKIVIEVEKISHSFDGRPVITNFSTKIMRGDKIGLIGPNGCGKTTLLKILLGQLPPEHGMLKIGTKLELAYFDQFRAELEMEKTVIENVAEGSDFIEINGRSRHVISYLQDFLFSPERLRQPVKALSGGEQNRLILARLFSKPANLLVLDEPTNDLDLETLELLEELLLNYEGTLLLVSHDREFLDNVVTSCIAFEGNGKVKQFVGGYRDWLKHGGSFENKTTAIAAPISVKKPPPLEQAVVKTKLPHKVQKELQQLPVQIETAEQEISVMELEVASSGFFKRPVAETEPVVIKLGKAHQKLEQLYRRWEELELLQQQ